MPSPSTPAEYNAWYRTARGAWIADREFNLMMSMMRPVPGGSLLDVGCGTGHFSRRFAGVGLDVTGIDPDRSAIEFARNRNGRVAYDIADARGLPFGDNAFDYVIAVTSLCFVAEPEQALGEMWRVSRKGVMLGLLNRHSLLFREREKHPGYAGARWDTVTGMKRWARQLQRPPSNILINSAVTFPGGNRLSRIAETIFPSSLPCGSFLAVYLQK